MSAARWAQFIALVVALVVVAPLLGRYMAGVYGDGEGARRPVLPARSSG